MARYSVTGGATMPQVSGKRNKKMGFMSVGDIDYKGVIYTIWVGSDPDLANKSWEMQKSKRFPDYTGPPPAGLTKTDSGAASVEDKRGLF
jgi:hypothetical protein